MSKAQSRLLRALVAAAQLQLALASAVFQRPRRRAAGIDATFHAVDLARGRARPAAAALEGARLPLVLCGAGVLLGHAGRAAREHGRACDYGHLQEPRADRHRDPPTPTVRCMSDVPPRYQPIVPTMRCDWTVRKNPGERSSAKRRKARLHSVLEPHMRKTRQILVGKRTPCTSPCG